ncbi:hypothetical protein PG991_014840 [Apiospora marii]|uniref:Uncharacterized protein n=2 Tax=Apiospora marii TaxID=335849 RepID=A0ABR1R4L1_9PEZI
MGDTPWRATTVEKVCTTSRVVAWLGELPGSQHRPDLMAHHVWSLVSAVIILRLGYPPQQLYVMYMALVTEAFTKANFMLAIFKGGAVDAPLQKLAKTGRLRKLTDWGLVLGFGGLRVPSVVYSLYVVRRLPLNLAGMIYYLVYTLYITFARARKMGFITLSSGPTSHYVLFDRFTVSRRSCLAGLARVATYVSSVTLYSMLRKQSHPQQPDADLEKGVAMATVATILLCRSQVMSGLWPLKAQQSGSSVSPKALRADGGSSGHSSDTLVDSSGSEDEKEMVVLGQPSASPSGLSCTPRGSWLQYALEIGVTILFAGSMGLPVALDSKLAASVIVTLPLAELIAPLGHRRRLKAAPRKMHVGLSAALHGALVTLTLYGITDILQAAQVSAALHLAMQVCPDYRSFAASRSSLARTCLAVACLAIMEWRLGHVSMLLMECPVRGTALGGIILVLAVVSATGLCAPGLRFLRTAASWAVRPMVYSSVAGLLILGIACYLMSQEGPPSEDRKALGRTPFEEILDSIMLPKTMMCLLGILLTPIMADIRSTATAKAKASPTCIPEITIGMGDQARQKRDGSVESL